MPKLLIIGNGFDLHLKLKSSFYDFFHSDIFQNRSNYNQYYNNVFEPSNFLRSFEGATKTDRLENIRVITEYPFNYEVNIKYNASQYASQNRQKNIDNNTNFWAVYFKLLEYFPNYTDLENEFKSSKSSLNRLERWQDVEYQIYYLLNHTENIISSYTDCIRIGEINSFDSDNNDLKRAIYNYESEYFSKYDKNKLSFIGLMGLLSISISLDCGWVPDEGTIYNFWLKELKKFGLIFNQYLNEAVENCSNYKQNATSFANQLVNGENYNLINFNYTSFYDVNDSNRVNIHSILSHNLNNVHPIFGITSYEDNHTENDFISNKVYYRFTKTYRIMSQTKNNVNKPILPSYIDEIIFYGHSFAQADYSYFDAIFDRYRIYDSGSKVKLFFKFSDYKKGDELIDTEPTQISAVYKLINQFARRIDQPNLLQKLLLENRISFDKI